MALAVPIAASAQDERTLARQLANHVAPLTSLQVQYNHDQRIGSDDARKDYVWLLPVLASPLNVDWNLIQHTYIPLISQEISGMGKESGLGDIAHAVFVSPSRPSTGGLSWGLGAEVQLPSATNDHFGNEKWGAGPAAVVVLETREWTYSLLVDHLWSFGGDDEGRPFSSTFVGPTLAYISRSAWTLTLNSEAIYDWKASAWAVPLNLTAARIVALANERLQLGGGFRYWAESPPGAPRGWGLRLFVTLPFAR